MAVRFNPAATYSTLQHSFPTNIPLKDHVVTPHFPSKLLAALCYTCSRLPMLGRALSHSKNHYLPYYQKISVRAPKLGLSSGIYSYKDNINSALHQLVAPRNTLLHSSSISFNLQGHVALYRIPQLSGAPKSTGVHPSSPTSTCRDTMAPRPKGCFLQYNF